MKQLLILLLISFNCFSQQYISVNGFNCYVHLPDDYNSSPQNYPVIINISELGSTTNLLNNGTIKSYINAGWDGAVVLPNATVKFIICIIQPTYLTDIKPSIQVLKNIYRIDTNRVNIVGYGNGGFMAMGNTAKTIINVQSNKIRFIKGVSDISFNTNGSGGYYFGDCCQEPAEFLLNNITQNIYKWIARENILSNISITPTNPTPTPTRKKYPYYYDQIIYLKETRTSPYIIVDAIGRIVKKGQLKQGENSIEIRNLSAGFYVFKSENKTLPISKL